MTRSMLIGFAIFWLLAPSLAGAVEVVVSLDGVAPATACNETWIENGVELALVPTAPEDCDGGGNCSFGIGTQSLDLFPSRLSLDLTTLPGVVTSAEVDVQDGCGTGCTKTFIYQAASIIDQASNPSTGAHTLLLDAGGNAVDRLAVSSCEGSVTEIRLEMTPTGGPSVPIMSNWGLVLLGGAAVLVALTTGFGANRRRA